MKKIFGILCLITLSLAGVSCHGDLDIAQKGQVTGGDAGAASPMRWPTCTA